MVSKPSASAQSSSNPSIATRLNSLLSIMTTIGFRPSVDLSACVGIDRIDHPLSCCLFACPRSCMVGAVGPARLILVVDNDRSGFSARVGVGHLPYPGHHL